MRAPWSYKMQGCTPPAAADTPASACTNDDVSPMPEFFRAPEGARTESVVRQDMERVEALHAPEYQLITPSSMEFTRERYVRAIPARPLYTEWDIDSMTVRISPGMGIVCYRVRLQFPSGRVVSGWRPDSDDEWGATGKRSGRRPPNRRRRHLPGASERGVFWAQRARRDHTRIKSRHAARSA